MDRADVFFDEMYNILVKRCIQNDFIQRIADLIYSYFMGEIKTFYQKHSLKKTVKCSYDKNFIKDYREKLHGIINLLEETDKKREKFMSIYPKWKYYRTNNIEHLNKIAQDLHAEKKIINTVSTITSVVGLAGGAAIAASILFPPATIVTIPAWLGGSAAAAFLPSCVATLVGTTTAATSTLAVTGGAVAAVSGASKIVTSVAEFKLLKDHMDEAKVIILEDKKLFYSLKELFTHTDSFINSLNDILNFKAIDHIFEDFFEFLALVKKLQNKFNDNFKKEIIFLFQKCIFKFNRLINLPFEYRLAVCGILFVSFLVYKNNALLFNSIVGACHLITGNLSLFNACKAITTTSAVTSAKTAPAILARNIKLFTFTGIGMALDIITIGINSKDMMEGSRCKYGKQIEKASDQLREELKFVENVYEEIQISMLNRLFLESQKPL